MCYNRPQNLLQPATALPRSCNRAHQSCNRRRCCRHFFRYNHARRCYNRAHRSYNSDAFVNDFCYSHVTGAASATSSSTICFNRVAGMLESFGFFAAGVDRDDDLQSSDFLWNRLVAELQPCDVDAGTVIERSWNRCIILLQPTKWC